jgi:hypothetical protein
MLRLEVGSCPSNPRANILSPFTVAVPVPQDITGKQLTIGITGIRTRGRERRPRLC